jgi:hypothetical protein
MTQIVAPPTPPKKSWTGYVGYFQSFKNHCSIRFRSLLEFYTFFLLEFDPLIISYQYEPWTIRSTAYKGILSDYTPDVFANRELIKNAIIEIKPEKFLNDPHTLQQLTIGKSFAFDNNLDQLIYTDKLIFSGYKLKNIIEVYRFRNTLVDYEYYLRCEEILTKNKECTLFDLAQHISKRENPFMNLRFIYKLLFTHFLETDINMPIHVDSLVWLRQTRDK